MSIARSLLTSALLSGVVFTALSLPLSVMGSKSVTFQIEEQSPFTGQVKEFAVPYLGLTTALSVGLGLVSLTTAGWRATGRKLSQAEAELETTKQQLQEKELLVDSLKFSSPRLQSSGLEFFLQDAVAPVSPHPTSSSAPRPNTGYAVLTTAQPLNPTQVQPTATVAQAPAALGRVQPVGNSTKLQAATALASGQPFMSFARLTTPSAPASSVPSITPVEEPASPQLIELLSHLKVVMAQIEQMNEGQPNEIRQALHSHDVAAA